jgi:hypothetical protein
MGVKARLLVALSCLALAGCTPAPAEPAVATAARSSAPPASATSSPKAQTDYDKALAYTRCMSDHGAPTPDPVAGQPLVTVNTFHRGDTAAMYTAKQDAFKHCKQFLPATWPLKMDPKEEVRIRKFVACVRQRGLDWPETGTDGMAAWPTDPGAMSTPEYDAATNACRHLVDDPANSLPENQ